MKIETTKSSLSQEKIPTLLLLDDCLSEIYRTSTDNKSFDVHSQVINPSSPSTTTSIKENGLDKNKTIEQDYNGNNGFGHFENYSQDEVPFCNQCDTSDDDYDMNKNRVKKTTLTKEQEKQRLDIAVESRVRKKNTQNKTKTLNESARRQIVNEQPILSPPHRKRKNNSNDSRHEGQDKISTCLENEKILHQKESEKKEDDSIIIEYFQQFAKKMKDDEKATNNMTSFSSTTSQKLFYEGLENLPVSSEAIRRIKQKMKNYIPSPEKYITSNKNDRKDEGEHDTDKLDRNTSPKNYWKCEICGQEKNPLLSETIAKGTYHNKCMTCGRVYGYRGIHQNHPPKGNHIPPPSILVPKGLLEKMNNDTVNVAPYSTKALMKSTKGMFLKQKPDYEYDSRKELSKDINELIESIRSTNKDFVGENQTV